MYVEKYKQYLDAAFDNYAYTCYESYRRIHAVLWACRFFFAGGAAFTLAHPVITTSTFVTSLAFFLCGYNLANIAKECHRIKEAVRWADTSRNVCLEVLRKVDDELQHKRGEASNSSSSIQ